MDMINLLQATTFPVGKIGTSQCAEKLTICTFINKEFSIESLFESWLMCCSFGKCQTHNASCMPFIHSLTVTMYSSRFPLQSLLNHISNGVIYVQRAFGGFFLKYDHSEIGKHEFIKCLVVDEWLASTFFFAIQLIIIITSFWLLIRYWEHRMFRSPEFFHCTIIIILLIQD